MGGGSYFGRMKGRLAGCAATLRFQRSSSDSQLSDRAGTLLFSLPERVFDVDETNAQVL